MTAPAELAVTVSVLGRFHGFDLARELQKRAALKRLITSYPVFAARRFGLKQDRVHSLPTYEAANRARARIPLPTRVNAWAQYRLGIEYDRVASGHILTGTNLFVGWAGCSLESIRRAKDVGARTVIERGSSHILFQHRILTELYASHGLRFDSIYPASFEREQREYEEADVISIPSTFVRDSFVQMGVDPAKLLVVPYGCDLGVFRPQPKSDQTFRVIHCGQVSFRKGVHLLVRAFAELALPGAELWLIGSPTPEIKPLLHRYRDYPIFLKGPFPQAILPDYYAQGSVFCLATYEEGLAMVIPQALGSGLPVIASANSGAQDVVEDGKTGFIVSTGNLDALKDKLRLMYENAEMLKEMTARVRSSPPADLSWSRYGEAMTNGYTRILFG